MVICKICGIERKCSLALHIKNFHKEITIEQYKKEYGEITSEDHKQTISDNQKKLWNDQSYKENISNKLKEKWSDSEYKNKMSLLRKEIYSSEDWKNKQKIWMKKYHDEFGSWNKGLTKDQDNRLIAVGQANSNRLKGVKNPEHSIKMKKIWSELKINEPKLFQYYNSKRSKTISEQLSNGLIQPGSRKFKTGWYNGFYYASSYELKAMELFDKYGISWTNKHGIKIPYIDDEGITHFYIPDFKILQNIIIEMKGDFIYTFDKNFNKKIEAAIKLYGDNYHIFFNPNDLENFILSII